MKKHRIAAAACLVLGLSAGTVLAAAQEADSEKTTEITRDAAADMPEAAALTYMFVNTPDGSDLAVHETMSADGETLAMLQNGVQVQVLDFPDPSWAYVTDGTQTGYCMLRYLSYEDPALQEVLSVDAQDEALESGNDVLEAETETDKAQTTADETDETDLAVVYASFIENTYQAAVTPTLPTSMVPMRWEPAAGSLVRAIYRSGDVLTVCAENGEWCQVIDEQTQRVGYVSKKHLTQILNTQLIEDEPAKTGAAGSNESLAVGALLTVKVDYNPVWGLEWTYSAEPADAVEEVSVTYEPSTDMSDGQNAGSQVYTFKALQDGEVTLRFESAMGEYPGDTYVVTYQVTDGIAQMVTSETIPVADLTDAETIDWQAQFEAEYYTYYTAPIDHYEQLEDGTFLAYALIDGEVVPFVVVDPVTGAYHG